MSQEPSTSVEAKLELARLRRQLKQKLVLAFDGLVPESKPTPVQESVLRDKDTQLFWILGGNRCLAEGTLVATPSGPVPIQELKCGDTVYDEHGNPIAVLATHNQGLKTVADLVYRRRVWGTATADHRWLCKEFSKKTGTLRRVLELSSMQLHAQASVCRVKVKAPLGERHVADAYALGALLGDGCSRQRGPRLQISSSNSLIPNKLAMLLGTTVERMHLKNYTWRLNTTQVSYYDSWCRGKYAHEKFVDLDELRTWDRASLLAFVAGVFDTDGSLTSRTDGLLWSISMQSKSVIDAIEYAALALWQIPVNRYLDSRSKYKNGPLHVVSIRNPRDIEELYTELNDHLVSPQKKWTPELRAGGKRSRPDVQHVQWGSSPRQCATYDITVDSPTNLYVLANGLVTHNSGKSTTGGRLVSWWFNNAHPYMARPPEWGTGPLQLLVVGRLVEQMESELWEKKIRPFVAESDIQVVRVGGALQRVVNRRNGNRIIFLSHHDAKNAREKIQAFTAHVAWLDEMPDDVGLVTELVFRVLSTRGRLYATFTPLLKNEEIRKIVDSESPGSRKVKLSMLDNPVYRGREAEVEAQARASCNSDAEFRARMYGEWYYGDSRVFVYDRAKHGRLLPEHYHKQGWRHLAVLDPAASGLAGLTVWAEDPYSGTWYNVLAKYLKGAAAFDLLNMAEAEVAPFVGPGLQRHCDCNPAGFYKEAARRGVPWRPYTEKNERKLETVDKFNTSLLSGKVVLTPESSLFEEELVKAVWSERDPNKIQGSSQYHLCDTARYAADLFPEWDPKARVVLTPTQEIRQAWKTRLAKKATEAQQLRVRVTQRRSWWKRH